MTPDESISYLITIGAIFLPRILTVLAATELDPTWWAQDHGIHQESFSPAA